MHNFSFQFPESFLMKWIDMNLKVITQVQKLQQQLQEEIDLHVALANAVAHNAGPLLNSPSKLPDKVCSNGLLLLVRFVRLYSCLLVSNFIINYCLGPGASR